MSNRKILPCAVVLVSATIAAACQAKAEVLKKEPPMGQMREGQITLVDDGTCPAGQIKQVIGGNHVSVGGTKHILRTRRCIPR